MARIRTIKPEFWTDGDMLKISRDARLFYIGLWNFCDDNGVLEYDKTSIKARIFPNDRISVDKLLTELTDIGKALIYEVEKRQYIFIKNLVNHQVIDRPRKSNLPPPPKNQLKSIEIKLGKEGRKGKEGNSQSAQLSDEEFIKSLKTNPVYKDIDIDRELAKMDVWLSTHPGRQKTRRFIINWLNKIDKPINISKSIKKPQENCSKCKGTGFVYDDKGTFRGKCSCKEDK